MNMEKFEHVKNLPEQKKQAPILDVEKLGNNDLAIIVLHQLGFSFSNIEDISFDSIKGTDLEGPSFVSGVQYGSKEVSLSEVLNQKGIYPEHFLSIGTIKIYPNYEELLEKTKEDIEDVVGQNPFDSLGTIFEKIKSGYKNRSTETFVIENTKTGSKYTFPKRFTEGFYHLAVHLQSENYRGNLFEKMKEQNFPDDKIQKIINMEYKKDSSREVHLASKYLQELVEKNSL